MPYEGGTAGIYRSIAPLYKCAKVPEMDHGPALWRGFFYYPAGNGAAGRLFLFMIG